jgi:hypothetical protein
VPLGSPRDADARIDVSARVAPGLGFGSLIEPLQLCSGDAVLAAVGDTG